MRSIQSVLDPKRVITDPVERITYESDSSLERRLPDAVVFPHSAEQVSRVARWAYANAVPLIGRGTGTGRSGGAVAETGGVIVEFSQMDRLLEFDPVARLVVDAPGMVNLTLDNIVRAKELCYPPDPSSGG